MSYNRNARPENNNEDKPKSSTVKKVFKVIGPLLLLSAVACFACGILIIVSDTFAFPWPFVLGIFLLPAGIITTIYGYIKPYDRLMKLTEMHKAMIENITAPTEQNRNPAEGIECICGCENPEGAKFCNECGKELTEKCPRCRGENPNNAKFCSSCGKELR